MFAISCSLVTVLGPRDVQLVPSCSIWEIDQFTQLVSTLKPIPVTNSNLRSQFRFSLMLGFISVARDFPSFRFASSLQLATGFGTFLNALNLRHVTRFNAKKF